jgi:hypothetical protein
MTERTMQEAPTFPNETSRLPTGDQLPSHTAPALVLPSCLPSQKVADRRRATAVSAAHLIIFETWPQIQQVNLVTATYYDYTIISAALLWSTVQGNL